jgi:Tfp pilus assembly protein PilE
MTRAAQQNGLNAIELVLLLAFLGVMGAVAWPWWKNIQRAHNEAYAIGSMRAIMSAQVDYRSVNGGFADNLVTLGKPCPGTPVAPLSPQLAKNGAELDRYIFAAAPSGGAVQGASDCNGIPTYTGYYATARPVIAGVTGDRAFAGDHAGMLWQSTDGVPPAQPFAKSVTVTPVPR